MPIPFCNENNLYERLIDEQIAHYQATGNKEVLKRGKETIKQYLEYIKSNRYASQNPVVLLHFAGITDEKLENLEGKLLDCFKISKKNHLSP